MEYQHFAEEYDRNPGAFPLLNRRAEGDEKPLDFCPVDVATCRMPEDLLQNFSMLALHGILVPYCGTVNTRWRYLDTSQVCCLENVYDRIWPNTVTAKLQSVAPETPGKD